MNAKKRGRPPAVIGGTWILTILVCVCLCSMSVMALLSANNELTLSEKTVEAMAQYYAADTKAVEKLSELIQNGKTGFVEFSVPCGGNSELFAQAEIYAHGGYKVLKWRKEYTAPQQFTDQLVNIWDGES